MASRTPDLLEAAAAARDGLDPVAPGGELKDPTDVRGVMSEARPM